MDKPTCINCGLPQSKNPHPNAGEPEFLNEIGAVWGCLPCTEQRSANRRLLISELRSTVESQEKICREHATTSDVFLVKSNSYLSILELLESLTEKYRRRTIPATE